MREDERPFLWTPEWYAEAEKRRYWRAWANVCRINKRRPGWERLLAALPDRTLESFPEDDENQERG